MAESAARKILIVEDNVLNMKLFSDLLQAHGYLTFRSSTGLDVIEIAQECRPDLILLDIQLPEISGTEIVKQIRSEGELCKIPVIAVTAYAMQGDEDRAIQAGCDGYLTKPISVAKFISAVEHYLM